MTVSVLIYYISTILEKSVAFYSGKLELKKWEQFCEKN